MIWIAEPRVNGFGFITEAVTKDVAATQCATNFNGGGAQQSTTVKVIFFPSTNGLVELVILRPFLLILTLDHQEIRLLQLNLTF